MLDFNKFTCKVCKESYSTQFKSTVGAGVCQYCCGELSEEPPEFNIKEEDRLSKYK